MGDTISTNRKPRGPNKPLGEPIAPNDAAYRLACKDSSDRLLAAMRAYYAKYHRRAA